jgi:hypothetical protein
MERVLQRPRVKIKQSRRKAVVDYLQTHEEEVRKVEENREKGV